MEEYKIKVIFGKGACQVYDETNGDIRAVKSFIKKDFGEIVERSFSSREELEAYKQGLEDTYGWESYWIID